MWKEITPEQIDQNVFKLIDKDWMLITGGGMDSFNTMTASWGGMGILWSRPVSFIFIRPQRYTYEFVDRGDYFTLCFFSEEYRGALNFCGSHSGRDTDKIAATGLKPVESEHGAVYFEQARLVLECRKVYYQDIDPGHMLNVAPESIYPGRDYHRMFIGEILNCKVKE